MRVQRAAVLVSVGAAMAAVMALGAAAPAGAVDLYNLRDYAQTLPASVIDGNDVLTPDEKVAWTNGTRAGVIDKPVAPIGTSSYVKSGGGAPLIGGGVSMLFYLDGALKSHQGTGEFWWKDAERPEWIDAAEWEQCSSSGDPSNIFDGLQDWLTSLQGTDCEAIRDGWDLERNPAYVPVGTSSGGLGGLPLSSCDPGGACMLVLQPVWNSSLITITQTAGNVTRQIGWVYPMEWDASISSTTFWWKLFDSSGALLQQWQFNRGVMTAYMAGGSKYPAGGCGAAICYAPVHELNNQWSSTPASIAADSIELSGFKLELSSVSVWGGPARSITQLPYVNPSSGSYTPTLERQQLLTSVTTESGAVYQCRTVSFLETAPTIPRPCEPAVPPGEIVTGRTVELVPETEPGYVPGSNPTRGIQTTTTPDVVRDWQRNYPDCVEAVCTLDLVKTDVEPDTSCFDLEQDCAEWYTDPMKEQKYQCWYGGYVMSLQECYKYLNLFKLAAVQNGGAYPQAPGQTGTQTSTGPGPAIAPGTQPSDPSNIRNCWAQGFAEFNPIQWVFTPIKCALEWAFVPRASAINSQFAALRLNALTKGPVVLATALTQWELNPTVAGCSGLLVPVSNVWPQTSDFRILQACGGDPLQPLAVLSSVVIGIAASLGALFAATRNLAGIVQYGGLSE